MHKQASACICADNAIIYANVNHAIHAIHANHANHASYIKRYLHQGSKEIKYYCKRQQSSTHQFVCLQKGNGPLVSLKLRSQKEQRRVRWKCF
jgi:cystathionine beta-lyase/cystathionine gamma-synthase